MSIDELEDLPNDEPELTETVAAVTGERDSMFSRRTIGHGTISAIVAMGMANYGTIMGSLPAQSKDETVVRNPPVESTTQNSVTVKVGEGYLAEIKKEIANKPPLNHAEHRRRKRDQKKHARLMLQERIKESKS